MTESIERTPGAGTQACARSIALDPIADLRARFARFCFNEVEHDAGGRIFVQLDVASALRDNVRTVHPRQDAEPAGA